MYIFLARVLLQLHHSSYKEKVENAHLLTTIARLPLHPRHKTSVLKMAMKVNKDIENWGYTAEFAQVCPKHLIPAYFQLLMGREDAEEIRRGCPSNGNAHPFSYKIDYSVCH